MTQTVAVRAQAKINLRLKVLSRGDAGFHAIETVFLRLSLADHLTVTTSAGGIELDVSGDPALAAASGPDARNLALVAARAFCDRARWTPGLLLSLEKHIPVGAGLGGGSADAAAVLRALNPIAPAPLPRAELLSLAATIGSDVPFLLGDDAMAIGWGRGERLMSLDPLPERPVVVAVPPVHVSTANAYMWLGRALGADPEPPALPGDAFESWERAAQFAENDFTAEVARRYPVIQAMQDSLRARGARVAMLTGSGSSVFGVFDSPESVGTPPDAAPWREILTSAPAHVVPVERMD